MMVASCLQTGFALFNPASYWPAQHAGVCAGAGGSALVDALEDSTVSHLWQWEVRDTKVLPKEFRAAAVALKKRAAKVGQLSQLNWGSDGSWGS